MKSIGLLMAASMVLAGCANEYSEYSEKERVSMANPAAVYCVQQDGELETVTENKQRVTYCVFSDDQRIEQWEYFRNNHKEESSS
ncbi:DUF333 domain-containing protein [Vibrio sp. T187]|uniref:putative hemolysin n=1 Tax=Vibrio TaxID=662 RepID=UPI0010C9DBAD|nr:MULTISPECIES: DUF333 domain-containing protein [Vibrio]MBW3695633.1 DUF333 domain-containing protein [Vibrio sp. T187]